MNNRFVIDEHLSLDYDMINQILMNKKEVEELEFKNILVNLDVLNNVIKNTNIKKIFIKNSEIIYENLELVDINDLSIDNIECDNYEFFLKFTNVSNLEISNLKDGFDCYYLRKLINLKILKINNLELKRTSGLGYLFSITDLYLYDIVVSNWLFITKISNLKTLHLNKNISSIDLMNSKINIVLEDK